jgi:hypothetical protein
MAIIRSGTFTVVDGSAAQNLVIGSGMSRPTHFTMWNTTNSIIASGAGGNGKILKAEWFPWMVNGAGISMEYATSPAITQTYQATNGFTPYVTGDESLWVPDQEPYLTNLSTNLVVTNISKDANAIITATHSFTSADIGVTWVTFKVLAPSSMIQMNTLRGQVQTVTGTSSFTVNIDSTSFTTFDMTFPEQANVITGAPVTTQFGSQVQMTPQYNLGTAGLIIGTSVNGDTSDVWYWIAEFDTSVNG